MRRRQDIVLRSALSLSVLVSAMAGAILLAATPARAEGIPAAYGALVLHTTGAPQRHEFDLNAALEQAHQAKKKLYVYLGAHDCRYCRRYEAFLARNAAELAPHFKPYVVVDLRSALMVKAAMLHLKVGDRSLAYGDFQRSIGDDRAHMLVYPTVWLLSPQGKLLMQLPPGTGSFETVAEQVDVLELQN